MSNILVQTKNLKKYFSTNAGIVHAVDDVTVTIKEGETLGVVGESGCGKSTLGRTIIRLYEPTEGDVLYEGQSIVGMKKSDYSDIQRNMQMIFQDPYSSLNPRMTVSQIIAEPIKVRDRNMKKGMRQEKIEQIMELCGISPRLYNTYPHEMDGGRRQRVGLARALALDPKFIVCDEPVSALDVSIQAQILNLLMDLRDSRKLSYMFITHDLNVVRHISNNIMVMYMGQVVEYAKKEDLFANQVHPYTQALLSAIPSTILENRGKERKLLSGEVANPINPAPGCRFAPRCPYATKKCKEPQQMIEVEADHFVACHEFAK